MMNNFKRLVLVISIFAIIATMPNAIAEKAKNVMFVKSDNLTSKPDKVHFNVASQREFGKRYFNAYPKSAKN